MKCNHKHNSSKEVKSLAWLTLHKEKQIVRRGQPFLKDNLSSFLLTRAFTLNTSERSDCLGWGLDLCRQQFMAQYLPPHLRVELAKEDTSPLPEGRLPEKTYAFGVLCSLYCLWLKLCKTQGFFA